MKTLILYYSYDGNTRKIAEKIREKTGGDLAEIETVTPYEGDYNSVVDQGQREVNAGYMPPIKPLTVDLSEYDKIYFGTPVWWYTYAPAVKTFFDQNDLSGKTICPFITNGGWIGHTEKDIQKACSGANVKKAIDLRFDGSKLAVPEKELEKWIDRNEKMANILTIYFSMKGQTIGPDMKLYDLEKGNTAVAAEFIQKAVGGGLFELEADREYSKDHMELIEEAKQELNNGTRVPVKAYPKDLDKYDTIFLGYPNWWGTVPMVVLTFLEQADLAGKRIIPFCTNEGGGLGNSVRDIKNACKDAVVEEGISLKGSQVRNSESEIAAWAKSKIR